MWQDSLNLKSDNCQIVVRNESLYAPESADNKFVFDKEFFLTDEEGYVASKHSVTLNCRDGKKYSCVLIAGGGGTRVHENSAFVDGNKLLVAVGNYVCALRLPMLEVENWKTRFAGKPSSK